MVSANSGVVQAPSVTGTMQAQPLVAPKQIIRKNGYIYIYVSNESARNMFFDNQRYGTLVGFVDYLSPHQPGDFEHPAGTKGRQFSTKEDRISSKGFKAWLFGNSKYEKIGGVEWGIERYDSDTEYHGHFVHSLLDELIKYQRSRGITVNDYR